MDNLKNIVVLKNLPSNLIDEAFFILKPNQKIENIEYTPKRNETVGGTKDYVVKEAEMIISSYLNKNNNNDIKKKEIDELKKKNKKLKVISISLGIITFIVTIINVLI